MKRKRMNLWSDFARFAEGRARKLENNTYLEIEGEGDERIFHVRFHNTRILSFYPDGSVELNTGGWKTVTTKDRLNRFGPGSIWSTDGVWYFQHHDQTVAFADGMKVMPNGDITGEGEDPKKQQKERRSIVRYAHAFVEALYAGKVPKPSGGDCWYCCMIETKTQKPLGEVTNDQEHIREHIKEHYYVPSLLVNALKAKGAAKVEWWGLAKWWGETEEERKTGECWMGSLPDRYRRAIRWYIHSQLGLAR